MNIKNTILLFFLSTVLCSACSSFGVGGEKAYTKEALQNNAALRSEIIDQCLRNTLLNDIGAENCRQALLIDETQKNDDMRIRR